jgi:hypothetical protein
MFSKILVAATALAAFASTSAYAANESNVLPKDNAEFTKWGEVEGWTVFVDQSRGTCLIERVDANTNVVQMGLTKSQDFGYLGVFTKADVKPKDNKVHLLLDGKVYYGDTSAKTRNLADGYKGGYILANNPVFVEDVMKKYTMSVYPEDANSFEVSL